MSFFENQIKTSRHCEQSELIQFKSLMQYHLDCSSRLATTKDHKDHRLPCKRLHNKSLLTKRSY
ncbi:Uncharacterised protein [Legionella feeleii]|uniref:Uncharacterized protein n=1 Tax=Legionella feeleii TaxID=453 RepID=A0A378ISU7_9GAMM|nr:Uncharacterised protein [Legionella feeleii]